MYVRVMNITQIILRKANGETTKHDMRTRCAQLQFPAVIVLINLYHSLSLVVYMV